MHLRTAADVFHRYLARGRDGSLVLYMVQLYPQYKQNSLQSDKAQCRSCCSCASVATYRYLATTLLFRSLASQFVNTCTCRFEPSLTRSAAKPVEPMTCSMHVRACMHPKWPVTGRFECNDQIQPVATTPGVLVVATPAEALAWLLLRLRWLVLGPRGVPVDLWAHRRAQTGVLYHSP